MAAPLKFSEITKKIDAWNTSYRENSSRGEDSISFTTQGSQWDDGIVAARMSANKETLVLNNSIKYLNRAINQLRQIEFVMDITPTDTPESPEQIKEYNAFKLLFRHLYNNPKQQGKYFEACSKALSYGYSVIEVRFDRENDRTLNMMPTVKIIGDPSTCFFDLNAKNPCKFDGDFCGYKLKVSKEDIEVMHPSLVNKGFVREDNEYIKYWYRKRIKVNYVQLTTGIYKRFDLMTESDKLLIARGKDSLPIVKTDYTCEVWLQCYCNGEKICKPIKYPTDDLPLVYNHSMTSWTPKGMVTHPYTYYMQDAQKLHNFVMSQLATTVKNSTSAKYWFRPDHIQNETTKDDAKNINKIEGGIAIGHDKEVPFPQKVAPDEVPQTLIALSQQSNQELESIAGSAFEMQQSDGVVVSGRALQEITHNIQMMNSGIVASNIEFINIICMLQMQMLPRIVTEERLLCVKDEGGKMVNVMINQVVSDGVIINNIKDIQDRFYYEIKASPTTYMQKDTTLKAMQVAFQVAPQLFGVLGDIYFKCIDSPYSGDMVRRLQAAMDQDILALSNGEISEEEFRQRQAQKQQQAQQQQQQQVQAIQQQHAQAMTDMSAAEQSKADAAQKQADNAEQKNQIDAINNQVSNAIKMYTAEQNAGQAQQALDLKKIHDSLEHTRNMIDLMTVQKGNANASN